MPLGPIAREFGFILLDECVKAQQFFKHGGVQLGHVKKEAAAILGKDDIVLAKDARDFHVLGAIHVTDDGTELLSAVVFFGCQHTLGHPGVIPVGGYRSSDQKGIRDARRVAKDKGHIDETEIARFEANNHGPWR